MTVESCCLKRQSMSESQWQKGLTDRQIFLQSIQCRWKSVKYPGSKEIKWVKNQCTIRQIKGTVLPRKNIFFGYKLHSVCSAAGVIQTLDLTKTSVHDVHYLKDINELFSNCIITGDKGYIGRQHQIDLSHNNGFKP